MSRREQSLRKLTTPRVDWFAVVHDLRRLAGLTTYGLCSELGVPRSTVLGWKQGAEPRHADGERLIELWVTRTGTPRERLPITRPPK